MGLLSPFQCRILASSRASILESSSAPGEEGEERDCSTATNRRCWFQWHPRSNGVKEREAPENLVTRLVTGNSVLGHTSYLFETGSKRSPVSSSYKRIGRSEFQSFLEMFGPNLTLGIETTST